MTFPHGSLTCKIESITTAASRAEALWLENILERQPALWTDVEWWMCPSRYTDHPQLARVFGAFEPRFWETLGRYLPQPVACLWTGPAIVPRKISLTHARKAARAMGHALILWDNYPVNDSSMSDEMHLAPLTGRDARLPEVVYGYLNNPLLQENLSFLPLATCFDYAADPAAYDADASWTRAAGELFGEDAIPHWRTIVDFCEHMNRSKRARRRAALATQNLHALQDAYRYVMKNRGRRWFEEFRPWLARVEAERAQR